MSDHADRIDHLPDLSGVNLAPLKGVGSLLTVIGITAFTVLLLANEPGRAFSGVLAGICVPLFLATGSLGFLCLHLVCKARWHAPLKRLLEGLSAGLPLALVGFLILAFYGGDFVYDWFNTTGDTHEHLFKDPAKAKWMSPWRWTISGVVILGVWIIIRARLIGLAKAQDAGADVTKATQGWSLAFMIIGVYSFTLLVWDLLLTLNVHAVSAMWGFYHLIGAFHTTLAVLALIVVMLGQGPLGKVIRAHTRHDLGTWILGLSCVWAYIAFAQYLIIVFPNMDEETQLLQMRMQHGYQYWLYIEAVFRLPIPFFLLLSQHTRTRPVFLGAAAVSIIFAAGVNLVWWVVPALFPNARPAYLGLPELAVAAGFLGITLLLAYRHWRIHGVVPKQDPDLLPSINAEHLH